MVLTFKNTRMIAQDLYSQLISNLELAKENCKPMSPQIKSSLRSIGSFLRSRSSQFEILENQEDISVFLSICKSNRNNLFLVFNYFLSDSLIMQNKKITASKFLKTMFYDFDKAVRGFEVAGSQTRPQTGFKVIDSHHSIPRRKSVKKNQGHLSLMMYDQK